MSKISRRDFLKLLSVAAPATVLASKLPTLGKVASIDKNAPNIIVFVLDAMTARNLSLYGYPRKTTPNLDAFAQKATVYHSHYATGNFTIPGTASILTGMYPWTHHAINQAGLIARNLVDRNFFGLIGSNYNRYAFGQNVWADFLLSQFGANIDEHLSPGAFGAIEQLIGDKLPANQTIGYKAYDDFLFRQENSPVSLIFGTIQRVLFQRRLDHAQAADYPLGLPGVIDYSLYFRLEDIFDGLAAHLKSLQSPFLGYYHLWAPHEPYRPRAEFVDLFSKDGWQPPEKPNHLLGEKKDFQRLLKLRQRYDEYIANVDFEFGRLMSELDQAGILETSYIFLTSDHGQMFERGVHGHVTPLMYEPVIHVPLIVSAPGQAERKNVYTPTSNVDLLPSLLSLTGASIPEWCQGTVLPQLGGAEDPQRSIFSMDAKQNAAFAPIKIGTVSMRKGKYKLIYYMGYRKEVDFELYDMENDAEEMNNLVQSSAGVFSSMKDELLAKLNDANRVLSIK